MNASAKPARTGRRPGPGRSGGSTLVGVIIGFVLGLGVAAAIAWVLTKSPNPFDGKSAKTEVASPQVSSVERATAKQGERPRFDFSKILPGTEERKAQKDEAAASPVPEKDAKKNDAAEQPADKAGTYFLQAGAYQNAADAEDQRAKLALMGIESSMQSVVVPDKGTLNRVRLGPYGTAEEMNQVKAELLKRGVPTAVIRNP